MWLLIDFENMKYTLRAALIEVFIDMACCHAPSAGFFVFLQTVLDVGKISQVCGTITQDDMTSCEGQKWNV